MINFLKRENAKVECGTSFFATSRYDKIHFKYYLEVHQNTNLIVESDMMEKVHNYIDQHTNYVT